jgi:hypothetical protein
VIVVGEDVKTMEDGCGREERGEMRDVREGGGMASGWKMS